MGEQRPESNEETEARGGHRDVFGFGAPKQFPPIEDYPGNQSIERRAGAPQDCDS